MRAPLSTVKPNTWEFLRDAMIAPTGFREYDAHWQYPEGINLPSITALGLRLGTQIHARGIKPEIAVGNDYRDYSLSIKNALILGLIQAGIHVRDIGPCVSPMAYFAQFHLVCPAVAMVTASHNPNGWTGVKMGFERPLTHGPEEMAELRDIRLNGRGVARPGGSYKFVDGVQEAYLDDLVGDFKTSRKLKVVCATGNGTAAAFAPELFRRIGVEVVDSHTKLDYTFPHYNPNLEAMEMLQDMSESVSASGADFALGFDGDGDRCGVVDDEEKELDAMAGFEKSGHYFLAGPIGRGYDCGMRVAVEICKLMDRNPDKSMSDLRRALSVTYTTPPLSPYAADTKKYDILARIVSKIETRDTLGGRPVKGVVTVNGIRIILDNGSWGLVRASSTPPNLVVVCESTQSKEELRAIFTDLNAVIRTEPGVGDYDQPFDTAV